MRLYDYADSGNGYKIRLLLAQLDIEYELVPVDILKGESRTSQFLQKNPNGRIPVLELDDGTFLAESNAILFYLAEGTPYVPAEKVLRAQVLQWMFFEQSSHEPNIATARFWIRHLELTEERQGALAEKVELGNAALAVMERHLSQRRFFVADRYSIADIALYAYTHVADQGNFDLEAFASVRAWCDRVRRQPGYVAML